ncbi:MAG TPA: helix-turn-helix transcriptional regulator [Sphingobium sp.]|uniref:response regulator transcription factor n=1 Tax=Sphingobium sp. TaxID=1912891 RepID=UPI002ED132C7
MSITSDQTFDVYLTPREIEVLMLVAHGLSAKEIAIRISIAPRTVERHIENARLKMHARNRTHLVICAMASGHLDAPGRTDFGVSLAMPALLPVSEQLPLPLQLG